MFCSCSSIEIMWIPVCKVWYRQVLWSHMTCLPILSLDRKSRLYAPSSFFLSGIVPSIYWNTATLYCKRSTLLHCWCTWCYGEIDNQSTSERSCWVYLPHHLQTCANVVPFIFQSLTCTVYLHLISSNCRICSSHAHNQCDHLRWWIPDTPRPNVYTQLLYSNDTAASNVLNESWDPATVP